MWSNRLLTDPWSFLCHGPLHTRARTPCTKLIHVLYLRLYPKKICDRWSSVYRRTVTSYSHRQISHVRNVEPPHITAFQIGLRLRNGDCSLSGPRQAVQLRCDSNNYKMYRYIVYVNIFITVNSRAKRDNSHHSKP